MRVPWRARNDDPASHILIRGNVFLSLESPVTTAKGRELEMLTTAAAKQGFSLKVAVVRASSDLGDVPQFYGRASKYARFMRHELTLFGFKGTLIVVMTGTPGGVAVAGPAAAAARDRVRRFAIPPNATLDQLANVAIRAVHVVAVANHVSLAPAPSNGNQSRDRLIIGAGLLAFIALALFGSRRMRRETGANLRG